MTRLISNDKPIATILGEDGNPIKFVWNGMHPIHQIHQHWEVDTEWWSEMGHVWREYFAVTTKNGLLCVLYHDLLNDEWHIERIYD